MTRTVVVITIAATIAAATVANSARRETNAWRELIGACRARDAVARDAARVEELRARQQTVADRKPPDQDIIARVNAVLAETGIAAGSFGGMNPEIDSALPGGRLRRQSVRISLGPLTMAEIGAFLERWSASQPLWTPDVIELGHSRESPHSQRFSLTLVCSAVYVTPEGMP